ncbi:MAG: AIPR family protein [Fischerella sp.]|nr:AIPR family protein [Fischerella sp.]
MSEHTYDWIKRQVDEIAGERLVQPDRAFAAWCLQYVHREIDIDEALIRTDTLRGFGGGDGGLDGWYKDEDEKEFHLWQCKWAESYSKSFGKQPALDLKNALDELLDLDRARQYGQKFLEVASKLQISLEHEYKIVLNVGLAGSMVSEAQSQFTKNIQSFCKDKSLRITWELWDLARFQQEYEDHHPSSEALEGQSYDFDLQSPEVIYMGPDDQTLPEGWEVIVASLQGKRLGTLAQDLGSRLFSLNVRFALGSNKRIKNIWESLVDPIDSQYFWLYNNGLTILCDDFKHKPEQKKLSITNPQVVNGCQTVTAFRKKLGSYSEKPSVLARIIKPPSNAEGKKQAILIAEKTNSQNPVLSRDLRSNDAVQTKLRKAFEQLNPPWFYERKRGEWGTLTNSEKAKFKDIVNGAYRKLDMEYVGQSWRMLSGQPSEALTQKRDLFDDDNVYSSAFNPRRDPEQFLFAALLRTKYEEFWHGNNFEGIRSTCGSYLTDNILRRMMNAKGQVVSHSVALTCRAIKQGGNWELKDARLGLTLINNFETKMKAWNRLMAKAFHEMLQAIDNDEESFGFKRTLEKNGGEALERLWRSIEATASIFLLSPEQKSLRDILFGNDS